MSRWFIARARAARSFSAVFADLVLDALAALGFLLLLALALPLTASLVDSLYSSVTFDWRPLAADARAAPWTRGSTVTWMLVTTLIPTAIHVLLGAFTSAIHLCQNQALVQFLRDPFAGLPADQRENLIEPLRATGWLSVNLGGALLVLGVPAYALLGVAHVPVADWLYGMVASLYGAWS